VLVHPDFVTILYLPDKIEKALGVRHHELRGEADRRDSLAIRPLKADAKPANLALATASIKVSSCSASRSRATPR
jgi:plasmid stability protein